jgi:ribosomal protein L3 glutamine methyltransferase
MNLDNQNLSQVSHELVTIRDYVRWAYSRFNSSNLHYGHGTDNAWDEALQLVLSTLHLPPDFPPEMLNCALTMVERRMICEFINRRIDDHIPTAYLTKEAWFAGMPFYVDQRVIIPRSPFGELIEKGFSPWLDNQLVHSILDLCTGSGCMAIACAHAFLGSHVDAVDISKDALEVAKINIKNHHVESSVDLIQGDLFENVKNKYDLIISNPPYVSKEEYASLPSEYKYEPRLALETDKNGIGVVERILKHAGTYLNPKGILCVEVGNLQELLCEYYPKIPFTWLEFERGGEGVFLLTSDELNKYKHFL